MLKAIEVEKSYQDKKALRGLDLHVPKGSVYGLLGPNGAGKSTLLRCLTGAYKADRGQLTLDGAEIWENVAAKRRFCYIPDDISAFPCPTVKDMAALYRGLYPNFDEERFQALGQVFRFSPTTRLRRLSKGMQKQAAFWVTLSARAEVLILDEPMDGLDPLIRRKVWQLIMEDVAERGTTVLISSHNLRELEDVCDRVGILSEGKMLLEKSLAELQEGLVKLQFAPNGAQLDLPTLSRSTSGKLETWIVRGDAEAVEKVVEEAGLSYYELLSMSLEEIFLHEIEGVSEEVRAMFREDNP